ncbi:MAG: hypothetical protein Q8S35_00665 [bacterium]|nr:hypothetical protein [bacterium]
MRVLATLIFSFVLLTGANAEAQEALTITTPPGKPLVWIPEFVIPDHNTETEVVAFRLLPFEVDTADLPFFVDREGIIVPKDGVDASVVVLSEDAQFVVLVCKFPESGPFNVALPGVRSEYCTLRRAERQP